MAQETLNKVAMATPKPLAHKIRGLSDRSIAWIFIAPTIFLLLAVNIFPLIWTIRLSFTNYMPVTCFHSTLACVSWVPFRPH